MNEQTPKGDGPDARFRLDLHDVRASLSDDPSAQAHLLERLKCVARILSAKNAQLGRPLGDGDLEDLVQETTLTIWNRRHEFSGRSALETWVYSFCYHGFMNGVRKLNRRPGRLGAEIADGLPAREHEDFSHVHRALEELTPEEADVVRARFFERMSFVEIGELLAITSSTAKHRYYRAIDRLRVLLASERAD